MKIIASFHIDDDAFDEDSDLFNQIDDELKTPFYENDVKQQRYNNGVNIELVRTIQIHDSQKNPEVESISSIRGEELEAIIRCKVCYANIANMISLPCMHLSCCPICSVKVGDQCPICRSSVDKFLVVYR